jgi:excisionase family DNA binding protein
MSVIRTHTDEAKLVAGGMLKISEAAAMMSVSRSTVERMLRDNTLPYARLPGCADRRIPANAVAELLSRSLVAA